MFNMAEFQEFMEMWTAFKAYQQMQQPTQPMPNPMVQVPTPAQQTSGVVEVIHNNEEVGSLRQQIAELIKQLQAKDLEIANLRQATENARHEAEEREGQIKTMRAELVQLKSDIASVEAYEGKSWEEYVSGIEQMSGQDYYEEKRQEWEDEGLTPQEKRERVSEFKETTKRDMIDFRDEARMDAHTAEEKFGRAKQEAINKNPIGVMREVEDGPTDRGRDFI